MVSRPLSTPRGALVLAHRPCGAYRGHLAVREFAAPLPGPGGGGPGPGPGTARQGFPPAGAAWHGAADQRGTEGFWGWAGGFCMDGLREVSIKCGWPIFSGRRCELNVEELHIFAALPAPSKLNLECLTAEAPAGPPLMTWCLPSCALSPVGGSKWQPGSQHLVRELRGFRLPRCGQTSSHSGDTWAALWRHLE